MCQRENEDALRFDTVDDAVRKLRDPGLPERGSRHGARVRVTPNEKDSGFNTLKKRIAQPGGTVFIEILGFEELPLGQRVPGRPDHRRRARASRKTSSESCASTSPRRISS
jgi:hypothetical protein